ncbi:MAG: fumarylacetoacetate hydrolase family protein [Propionibacteriaceae bacterium]|jgi:2-keto-4-pentenoate hydratase/2-oxohepta-3-ene-1,7-dioic acid hydratase in catechol pathway|nr:fumarylacetoacetate hydrolase family protein [Propionibacteriaceae bacterium]
MKLAQIGPRGAERPIVEHQGRWFGFESIRPQIDPGFWGDGTMTRIREALDRSALPEVSVEGQRFGAPITRPSAIICLGHNYHAHVAESAGVEPTAPIIFLKTPNTLGGPDDDVPIPRGGEKTDWEVELGVVIGQRASYLASPAEALGHIGGFVAVDDLSERRFQFELSGGQFSKGKACAGFCPTGPYLVTADSLDPGDLRLRSWVNGQPRQDSTTADMIFDVATIVHDLSQYLVLEPGDLISTGSPQGVASSGRFPFLTAGDVVEVEIDQLGHQRHRFIA